MPKCANCEKLKARVLQLEREQELAKLVYTPCQCSTTISSIENEEILANTFVCRRCKRMRELQELIRVGV